MAGFRGGNAYTIVRSMKSSLNYNQRQTARLGVAKGLGDSVGFLAGTLRFCRSGLLFSLAQFRILLVMVGFDLSSSPEPPLLMLWAMCVLTYIGTNGETYFSTIALVPCVQNFPKSRGPLVGILKGFAGLGGAILTQIFAVMHSPDHASLMFMVAVGPTMVVIALMFMARPVGGHKQIRSSDGFSLCYLLHMPHFGFLSHACGRYSWSKLHCYNVTSIFTVILFVILLIPIVIPITLSFFGEPRISVEEALLPDLNKQGPRRSEDDAHDIIFSEIEDEKPREVDMLPVSGWQNRITELQAKLAQAAADGAVRIKKRRPHRGEDSTLMEAFIKADFWLIFFCLLLGSVSGLTVIDNLGQMSQSLGYDNNHVFISMISIWNFLGRICGGYFSEKIGRDYSDPRPIVLAAAQVVLTI
ncbi:Major facilitator superfamily protein [Perilla frutescens var. frutescens]|nr:Major facilitator superfamily protein [Perilla frutescens var. frutescens]